MINKDFIQMYARKFQDLFLNKQTIKFLGTFGLLSVISLLAACASVNQTIVALTSGQYTPMNPDSVQIFASTLPKQEYIELAMVRSPIFRYQKVYATNDLKKLAATCGADAVIRIVLTDNFISGVAVKLQK